MVACHDQPRERLVPCTKISGGQDGRNVEGRKGAGTRLRVRPEAGSRPEAEQAEES